MRKTFVIMAGGTGGHVFPGLAVAGELAAQGYTIEWLGTRAGIESTLVPAAGYSLHCLPVSGVRGRGLVTLLKAPIMIARALLAALRVLRELRPDAVLGLGGFAAGPGAVAARLLGTPLILHEQNSVLGTTNGILQHIANRRLEGFPNTFSTRRGTFFTGNPVRKEIAVQLEQQLLDEDEAESQTCKVLIIGGSRGARALNETVPALLGDVVDATKCRLKVVHQAGSEDCEATLDRYQTLGLDAEVLAFVDDMAAQYQSADILICRAGAMTVAEVTAVGIAALLVPFPHAIDDHQTENARWLTQNNAGLLVPQAELANDSTAEQLSELVTDKSVRETMAKNAKALAVPQSAKQVADHCSELAAKKGR